MITAFLIATLVFFSLSLILSLLTIAISSQIEGTTFPLIQAINVIILLGMITWNIIALASL